MGKRFVSDNPKLLSEWHPTKNGDLTPSDVTVGSNKKVWWRCERGHEWDATAYNRAKGQGCPYCFGKRVCADNSLQALNPKLSKQWHPTKNERLTPDNVTVSSGKKVWWQCEKGHEWEATVVNRAKGNGCPYCSGKRACADNSLQTLNPLLSEQWHPTKNGDLTPNDVTSFSHKKVWWQCEKGHEWEVAIANRSDGKGCPYCSGRYVCADNSLQTLNPILSKQWHPTKNGDLTPNDVTSSSGKKVWWQCEKGHNWKATVAHRANGTDCPYCAGKLVCADNCLQTLNPDISKQWHPTKNWDLTPSDVTLGSNKKIWWQCKLGHEWQAAIYSRANGRGCPHCRRMKVSKSDETVLVSGGVESR
jgi:positive regulator of sigma E activity